MGGRGGDENSVRRGEKKRGGTGREAAWVGREEKGRGWAGRRRGVGETEGEKVGRDLGEGTTFPSPFLRGEEPW